MDMPLQHAHPEVLRAMLRPSNGERYLEIIERVPRARSRHHDALDLHRRFPRRDRGARRLPGRVDRPRRARPRRLLRIQLRGRDAGGRICPARSRRASGASGSIRLREAQRLASERARAQAASVDACACWSKSAARCAERSHFAARSEQPTSGSAVRRARRPASTAACTSAGDARARRFRRR